jgi:MtN3 and saliva related transmembrane protein
MNDVAWYALGAVAAALTSFGFVPQILKMWKTKSVRDVSPIMLLQITAGVILWAIYGAHLRDPVVLIANLVSFSTLAIAIAIYLRYFRKA